MRVRVVLTVDIKAGEEQEFEQEFREVAQRLHGAPGMLGQMLCRDAGEPSRYTITSDWATREQFHAFETSSEQDEATAPVRRHRTAVQMHVYDVVHVDEGAGQ